MMKVYYTDNLIKFTKENEEHEIKRVNFDDSMYQIDNGDVIVEPSFYNLLKNFVRDLK